MQGLKILRGISGRGGAHEGSLHPTRAIQLLQLPDVCCDDDVGPRHGEDAQRIGGDHAYVGP